MIDPWGVGGVTGGVRIWRGISGRMGFGTFISSRLEKNIDKVLPDLNPRPNFLSKYCHFRFLANQFHDFGTMMFAKPH